MNKENVEIIIGNVDGEHVTIRLLSRSHPGADDFWDGNWLVSEIRIMAGGFEGNYQAQLRTDEFQTFRRELDTLNQTLKNSATFAALESQLAITLKIDSLGCIKVEGTAIDVAGTGNRLEFSLPSIDQTYLPALISSLEHALSIFPVIGSPTQ